MLANETRRNRKANSREAESFIYKESSTRGFRAKWSRTIAQMVPYSYSKDRKAE
jgi:hypothetical protein